MKKTFFDAVIVLLIFSFVQFSNAMKVKRVNFFSDVHVADWFYEYVESLREWGIVEGEKDGEFGPDQALNRAEFAKSLVLYDQRVDEKINQLLDARNVLPTVMQLELLNEIPPLCPTGWNEVDFGANWEKSRGRYNYLRTCITDQKCTVMRLEKLKNIPAECPSNWSQANYGAIWDETGRERYQRVCYICE